MALRRRARNAGVVSRLRSITKKFIRALDSKGDEPGDLKDLYQAAIKEWEKAASKNVIKRRAASRHVSRLTLKLNKAGKKA